MASEMELWWGSGSGPCWSVMIVLEEKGLQGYKSHQISFSKKEHKEGDVLKLNPRGQVPTFRHGNVIINESQAVCDYLEAAFANQGHRFLPADPVELSQVLQRKYETINFRKKIFEDYIYLMFRTKEEDRDKELMEQKKAEVHPELTYWESYLRKNATNGYLEGKDFSMADVVFYPQLAFLVRVGLKLEDKYPNLHAYYNKITARPSVKATWPPHWKETPNGTQLAEL